jgi:hypothetical protein
MSKLKSKLENNGEDGVGGKGCGTRITEESKLENNGEDGVGGRGYWRRITDIVMTITGLMTYGLRHTYVASTFLRSWVWWQKTN